MRKLQQHRLTPKYDIIHSFVTLMKHYNMTMEEDDNKFKITCQRWNGFVTCSGWGGELLYISFLRDEISTLLIHPEEIVI